MLTSRVREVSPFSVWADRRETRSYLAELMSEMVNVEEKSWESAIENLFFFYIFIIFIFLFLAVFLYYRFDDFFFVF